MNAAIHEGKITRTHIRSGARRLRESDRAKADQLSKVRQIGPALKIIDAALAENPNDTEALLMRVKVLGMAGRNEAAMAAVEQAAPVIAAAGNRKAHALLAYERGFILMRMKKYEAALEYLLEATKDGNPQFFGTICVTLAFLGRFDEAVEWRHRILQTHDAEVSCAPEDVITAGRPRPFDPTRPERNIVAYSLFGSNPFYHECAITNARVTPIMFPEFTARFHCAADLPMDVLKSLDAAGAQVLISRNFESETTSPMAGKFWRFLAFDDPDVDVVLCRDVDSPILPRERAAIDMWLASSAPFYCMRDHPIHAELILAGLWGGFTGVLPPLGPLVSEFVKTDHSLVSDQIFLRTVIWPRVRDHAMMSIDSIQSLDGSVDFPEGYTKYGRLHVGIGWTRSQILGTD